jgi:hypothetical protein
MLNNASKLTINFSTVIATITAIVFLQLQALNKQTSLQNAQDYLQQEKQQKIQANLLKNTPSFGFNNLISDLAFLQFVQYFGDSEAREVTGYSVVTDYFEAIVERDPNFIQSFFALSSANSLFAAKPEKTVELIDRVLKVVTPESPGYPFFLWTYKATDEILFLGDLQAAENSYQMAASWASLRGDELGKEMAERFQTTAEFLATNPDPTQAQIGAWITALSGTKDEKTKKYILGKLQSLGAEIVFNDDGNLVIKPLKRT